MLFAGFQRCSGRCSRNGLSLLAGAGLMTWPIVVHAQGVDMFFPSGAGGYDQDLGVTVQSRARPLYAPVGIQLGSFNINPRFDQSAVYDSNPTGISGEGTWESRTSASISAGSLWDRDSLGMSLGFNNIEYLSQPGLDHTDWNVGLGGGYTIGDSALALSYSHQSYHELSVGTALNTGVGFGTGTGIGTGTGTGTVQTPILGQAGTSLGTVQTETPILDNTDTAQASYTFNFSRFAVTPDVSVSAYRFGTATVLGVSQNQNYLDRNVVAGGVTTRYSMSDVGGLLVVVRGVDNIYTNPQVGVPSNDAKNLMVLGGIDYQAEGVWHYRVLAGVEYTTFAAPVYAPQTGPIVQASVTWTPIGTVTVTGTLGRAVEAPQSAGTNGFSLTSANLVADYEFRRNILLQGRGGFQYAQYFQGGSAQTNFTIGGGISWLLNRKLSLSLNYDYTDQSGTTGFSTATNLNTITTGAFIQNLLALTLRVAL